MTDEEKPSAEDVFNDPKKNCTAFLKVLERKLEDKVSTEEAAAAAAATATEVADGEEAAAVAAQPLSAVSADLIDKLEKEIQEWLNVGSDMGFSMFLTLIFFIIVRSDMS